MNGFEEFIDFLASKGVKSFHIELQARELSETQERVIERKAREIAGKHDVPVHRGEPETFAATLGKVEALVAMPALAVAPCEQETERLARLARIAKDEGVAVVTAAQKPPEAVAVEALPPLTPPCCGAVDTEPESVAQPVAEPAKPEPAKELKVSSPKAEAKPETKSEKAPVQKPYEAFCDAVNKDDGSVTKEDRLALIDAMGLDDLLRVNNDFALGLDTDKPVEAVREDVKGCF